MISPTSSLFGVSVRAETPGAKQPIVFVSVVVFRGITYYSYLHFSSWLLRFITYPTPFAVLGTKHRKTIAATQAALIMNCSMFLFSPIVCNEQVNFLHFAVLFKKQCITWWISLPSYSGLASFFVCLTLAYLQPTHNRCCMVLYIIICTYIYILEFVNLVKNREYEKIGYHMI